MVKTYAKWVHIRSSHQRTNSTKEEISITCYNCGTKTNAPIKRHKVNCPARSAKCYNCQHVGHFSKFWKSTKNIKGEEKIETDQDMKDIHEKVYNVNLFRITTQNVLKNQYSGDFKVEVFVNNNLATVTADTKTKVSVCSLQQAKKWKLMDKMFSTNTKLKPFNCDLIKVEGQAICAVTFRSNTVPVKWQIIAAECEPILAGNSATALGIIECSCKEGIIEPINMIHTDPKGEIQSCLAEYSHNFHDIGKLKNYQIRLCVNAEVKPVATPPCSLPYHFKEQLSKVIQEMINQDIIEEHPINQPAPWVSNAVIAPKTDGSIRMTLSAHNLNTATYHDMKTSKQNLQDANGFQKWTLNPHFGK